MKKILQTLWNACALSSLRALFDSDAYRIISREGEEYIYNLEANSVETVICAAFCGCGKTYICENTSIKSVEVEYWRYKNKGLYSEYVEDVKKYLGKVDYIFISTEPDGMRLLNFEGFNITLVYPKNELRDEYLSRYVERDSPCDFIGAIMKYWHIWIDELKEQDYCKHIVLESGQYLQDVIKNNLKTK